MRDSARCRPTHGVAAVSRAALGLVRRSSRPDLPCSLLVTTYPRWRQKVQRVRLLLLVRRAGKDIFGVSGGAGCDFWLAGSLPEQAQHPGVAQRVRFDVLQAEELGHARVVGAAQRVVGVGVDRRALDLDEAVPGEEAVWKVSANSRRSPSSRAVRSARSEQVGADPPAAVVRCTASVRISPRSAHSTCSAPQPTTCRRPTSATRKSWTSSYRVTSSLASSLRPSRRRCRPGLDRRDVGGPGPPDDRLHEQATIAGAGRVHCRVAGRAGPGPAAGTLRSVSPLDSRARRSRW